MTSQERTFALFTVTWRGDIFAFKQLCNSIDRWMPDVRHIVAVDHSDVALFSEFAGPFREIVDCSEFLPSLHEFSLFGRRLWWKFPFHIIRGWIYQQLSKIAIVSTFDEAAIVIVDSDVVFIRKLETGDIFDNSSVVYFRNLGASSGPPSQSSRWHDAAATTLGLPMRGYTGADYISGAVIWSTDVVRAMLHRIESIHGGKWLKPLLRHLRISEYVTYGVFCDHVSGPHRTLISPTPAELAHCSWNYDFDESGGVEMFVSELPDDAAAVLVQSNLNMAPARREEVFARIAEKRRVLTASSA